MEELTKQVVEQVVDRVAREILDKLVDDETGHGLFPVPPGWESVLQSALRDEKARLLEWQVMLDKPIVAIGAPVSSFIPQVADKLHTRCLIPEHAEVGNAVGAAVASVTHTVEILVQPHIVGAGTLSFRVHTPSGPEQYNHYPEAITHAEEIAVRLAQETVLVAGAEVVSIKVDRHEVSLGKVSEMTVRATAIGKPSL